MTTNQERAVRAATAKARAAIVTDLQQALADSGMRVAELARASGLDDGFLSRVVAGKAMPSTATWARIAVPLGLDLSMRLYPNTGPPVHDRFAAPMLELLLREIHPRFARFTEVGVHRPSRGWIDLALHDAQAQRLVASELQSELRRIEQLVRWQQAKADSLPSWEGWMHLGEPRISRLLVVRRTRTTRRVATDFANQLRLAYPAHGDDALASLTGTSPWPGAAVVWVTVEAGRARWAHGR